MTGTTNTAKPILFSGPMVRAILEGRKTQTRRVVKPQPMHGEDAYLGGFECETIGPCVLCGDENAAPIPCPYGQPGDRLWVRETWANVNPLDDTRAPRDILGRRVIYRATEHPEGIMAKEPPPWRPSIHMPRWASRITLEIVSVRVERLQRISGMDAKREGVGIPAHLPEDGTDLDHARREFTRLWESINGPGSWDANPWVWVVEFKRIEQEESR